MGIPISTHKLYSGKEKKITKKKKMLRNHLTYDLILSYENLV